MKLQTLRLVVAYIMGAVFLTGSLSHNPLGLGMDSRASLIRLFLALFGITWIMQAIFIQRRLSSHRG